MNMIMCINSKITQVTDSTWKLIESRSIELKIKLIFSKYPINWLDSYKSWKITNWILIKYHSCAYFTFHHTMNVWNSPVLLFSFYFSAHCNHWKPLLIKIRLSQLYHLWCSKYNVSSTSSCKKNIKPCNKN